MKTGNKGRNQQLLEMVVRRGRNAIAATGVFSVFLALIQLVLPLYTMQVYDRVLGSRSAETLVSLIILAVGCFIVYGLLEIMRSKVYVAVGHFVTKTLMIEAFETSMRDLLRGNGSRPSQVLRDFNDIRQFLSGPSIALPFDATLSLIFLFILYVLHPIYGTVAVASALLLVGISALGRIATAPAVAEANGILLRSAAEIDAASQGAEVIEAMGMMPNLTRRWQGLQQRYLTTSRISAQRSRIFGSIAKVVRMTAQVAIVGTGAALVMQREVSPGSMLAASFLMSRSLAPFEQIIEGWRSWILAREAYCRVRDLLVAAPDPPVDFVPNPKGRLIVDRVSYVPPGADRPVLRNISFEVEPGQALGILGSSAAGKSTLARLIMGLIEPSMGGVYLDGQSTFNWKREHFGKHVGYMPQTVCLLGGTVAENIARMGDVDQAAVIAAARRADVHEMVGRLPKGYQTDIGDGGVRLSGGQRQRIALARALYGEPCFIVLDEPNSNLDQAGEAALVQAIAESRKSGATVVVITHRPAILSAVDRIIILRDGMIDQVGSRAEVFKRLGAAAPRSGPTPVRAPVAEQSTAPGPTPPRLVTS
jgi:ATP-binding cassette, subfamily C, bacterial